MKIADKNILVVGLGMSGAATACFLKKRGAVVTVTDMAKAEELGDYAPMMRELGVRTEFGEHRIETFENADFIVISPGVPHTIPPIKAAQEKGVAVLGEIELASRFIQAPIVAITGTNGKTTTTKLVGKMLEASGFTVFVGGNIGNPLIRYADNGEKADIVVAEVSSFQLDTIDTFRPEVGVLLNITEDHLDRYPNFTAYARSKGRIFENQQENDSAVLDSTDPIVSSVTEHIKSRKLETGNWMLDAGSKYPASSIQHPASSIQHPASSIQHPASSIQLMGRHNMENVSAASLAALAVGGTPEGIQSALNNFKVPRHRLEYVATINDVMYFDDSKATNSDAVARALECFDKPVILIMGGRGKGIGRKFKADSILRNRVSQHTKKLIAIGESRRDIKSEFKDVVLITMASSMEDAVSQAYHEAEPGDVVLLSPACSSFDMYRSYAERGETFCQAVRELNVEY
ncbi:UDP-N-acetylmuramoyl-L-alanine--D-glutamate ligase [Desulfobacterales bacterium HSG2]|nr:UDP-N-acetylmuramoyl-L-alanine--D-glutamate ligase [Desulfobacterales bacterium HSG2]